MESAVVGGAAGRMQRPLAAAKSSVTTTVGGSLSRAHRQAVQANSSSSSGFMAPFSLRQRVVIATVCRTGVGVTAFLLDHGLALRMADFAGVVVVAWEPASPTRRQVTQRLLHWMNNLGLVNIDTSSCGLPLALGVLRLAFGLPHDEQGKTPHQLVRNGLAGPYRREGVN